jgi:predicted kinase
MARIHLLLGPVGAGKSTFAATLCETDGAVHLDVDQWMAVLFRPDRPDRPDAVLPWYRERVERCIDQIWRVAQRVLAAGTDVVLELGLVQRVQRADFWWRVDSASVPLTIHVLDAPREVRRARVQARNAARGPTFQMEVPDRIFELACDAWQPLTDAERDGRNVRDVTTG